MSTAETLHADRIWRVLEERQRQELRFRSAMITSTAVHAGLTIAILLAPLLIPKPQIFEFTPVNLVQLQPPAPEPAPTPAPQQAEEQQAPEPEPEIAPPPPEDVPEDLEAQRIREEEEAARRREEERKQREAEEERRRLAEEARRRRELEEQRRREAEEQERRQPQKAARRETTPSGPQQQVVTQQSQRGAVDFGVEVSAEDYNYLSFWINRVLTNINNNWTQQTRPPGSRAIEAIIHFRVDRNGRIIEGPEVRSTSRDRRYDDAAVRAVLGGQPFPPLPQAYRGATLAINLKFRQE